MDVTRASMLERQRQVALRRRQNRMYSTYSIRTNADALGGQSNVLIKSNTTQVELLNHHPTYHEQQAIHRIDQMTQGSIMNHGYSYNCINDRIGLAFRPHENTLLPPTTRMIRENTIIQQTQELMPYDNDPSQQYHYNSQYSTGTHSHNHKFVRHRVSGDDMSELTDARMEEDQSSLNRHSTFSFMDIEEENSRLNSPSGRHLKLQRSNSSRSLTFNQNPKKDLDARNRQLPSSNRSKMSSGESSSKEESEQNIIHFIDAMESILDLNVDNPSMLRTFLTRPCPKGVGMMKCYIKRNKGIKNKLFPEYRVYLKESNTFLMTSKKRMGNATSNYLISMGRNDFDNRQSPNVLGKLRSNFLGTEYTIFDGGRNPQYESLHDDDRDEAARCEIGAILYASSTSLGAKRSRKMTACIGKLDVNNNPSKVWQPMNENDDRIFTSFKDKESSQNDLISFISKEPSWNKETKVYDLNFNGPSILASVKNFQLVNESDQNMICLQFGRAGKDEFILDLQWPLSPLQAFAFALSSFDSKLGCD